ncbi:hypothetical protein HDU96_001009 [Phlyctochytrium bullatum]|nr:hypothetical protein HDU96_001009 [Phlyctochytrium bullatum]
MHYAPMGQPYGVAPPRKVFIEFLLSRPTIDLPPIEHLHAVSSMEYAAVDSPQQQELVMLARKRTIDGVVRITVEHVPLEEWKLIYRVRVGRLRAHETLLKLLLWQPGSREEFEAGLQVGRHDFPFALDIPSNLHTSNENVKVPQIPPGPCGSVSDHFRSYELTATLHSLFQNVMAEDSASRPLAVRRCYPLHWFRPFPTEPPAVQRCVGTTAPNGEFAFRAILPKVWNAKDKRDILLELQLDDGTEPTSRVTLVEAVLMQRLRHREAPVNGAQPSTSAIPSTITGSVGGTIRCKPPVLAPGSPTIFMNFEIPMSAMQPDAELDPFLLEHVIGVTVTMSKMMSTKRCTFYLPLKLGVAADDDDRLLQTLPAPMGWFTRPQNPQRRSSVAMTASSGGSTRGVEKKDKIKDLADVMSLGVMSPTSPQSTRKPGSSRNDGSNYSGGRRKSTSSQGSAGSGRATAAAHGSAMASLTNGMNDLMLGGGGGGVGSTSPGGALNYSNSMRSSGGVSMGPRTNSQEQWGRSPVRYSNASSGSGGGVGGAPNGYGVATPISPVSHSSASSAYGGGGGGIGMTSMTSQSSYVDPASAAYNANFVNGAPNLHRGVPAFPATPTSTASSAGYQQPMPPTTFAQTPIPAPSVSSSSSPIPQPLHHKSPSPSLRNLAQPTIPSHTPVPPPQPQVPPTHMASPPQSAFVTPPPSNPPTGPLPPPPSVLSALQEKAQLAAAAAQQQPQQQQQQQQQQVPVAVASSTDAISAGNGGSHVFRVQYAFAPTLEDEIGLDVGDLVEVLEVFDDGWARGRSLKTDIAGYFPVRCLTLPTASGAAGSASGQQPQQQQTGNEKAKFEEAHGLNGAGPRDGATDGEGLPRYSRIGGL